MNESVELEFQSSYDDGYLIGYTINGDLKYNPYKYRLNYERYHHWNSGFFDGRKNYLTSIRNQEGINHA